MDHNGTEPNRRLASTKQDTIGAVTLLGWFVLAGIAALWIVSASKRPGSCDGWCLLVTVYAPGWLAGIIGLIIGALVLSRLHRRARSGLATGTTAAAIGLSVAVGILMCCGIALAILQALGTR